MGDEGSKMTLSRSLFTRSAVAAGALAGLAAPVRAQTPKNLRVIYFPSADILPWYIAVRKGFFPKHGVTVTMTPTPGSVYQFQHLSAGDFDIALTAIDNAIAYDEGQGQAPLPNPADFVAFMGGDNALLSLYARPEIKSYADLRGKQIAVDALTTGFAFVLRKMLDANGLHDGDYTLVPAGGTLQRFQQLTTASNFAATLLTVPFDVQARALGFTHLGDAVDTIGHYQGIVSVASRAWIATATDAVVGYVRGVLDGLHWMYDPANRAEATRILIDSTNLAPDLAAQVFPALVDGSIDRNAKVDDAGLLTVLTLRSQYGTPRKTLSDPLKYYDDRLYRRALAAR
jgi:ABC-type nitrate/sulfonate/bicarbonate transport system substrate-binding protein